MREEDLIWLKHANTKAASTIPVSVVRVTENDSTEQSMQTNTTKSTGEETESQLTPKSSVKSIRPKVGYNLWQIPPAGWHFWVDDVKIIGSTYPELIENIVAYKLQCRMLITETLIDEVMEYFCKINPIGKLEGYSVDSYRKDADILDMNSILQTMQEYALRVYETVNGRVTEDHVVVQTEANRRGEICASCPFNVEWRRGCGKCIKSVQSTMDQIMGRRTTSWRGHLRGCRALGYELSSAVWFKDNVLGPKSTDPQLPHKCWRKQQ